MLLFLGTLLAAALVSISALGDLRRHMGTCLALWAGAHAVYAAAAWWATRRPRRSAIKEPSPGRGERPGAGHAALWIVVGVAIVMRLPFLWTEPTLSEDVFRYVWDGRLVAHGVNPYLHAPADSALAPYHDALLRRLNHFDVPTIYPPAAQLLFGAIASVNPSARAFRIATLPIEAALWVALLFLLRRRGLAAHALLLFAWNPLVVIESYGSGHLDLWMAAFLVISLALMETKRSVAAGAAFATAVMTKYTPLLLAPYLVRRRRWILLGSALAIAVLLTLPFLGAGPMLGAGLATYLRHWEFNGGLYKILRALGVADPATRTALAAALAAASLWISLRARTAPGAAMALFTAYLLASPTLFPWYLVPVAALFPLYPNAALIAFSGLVALSYWPLPAYHATGRWMLPDWILWVEYGGLLLTAAAAWWIGRRPAAQARRAAWATESSPT